MMAEPKAAKTDLKTVSMEDGLPATLVHQSWGLAERAALTYFAFLRDLRAEVSQRFGSTLDWIEGLQHGAFKLARDASMKVDKLALDATDAGENVTLAVLGTGRTTALSATEIAARTASSLT